MLLLRTGRSARLEADRRGATLRQRLTCMCMQHTFRGMRTTIDIPDEQRAKLLKLAAERGEKGFSRLVQEALDRYLDEAEEREQRVRAALAALGTLSEEEAAELEESIRRLRSTWR